MVISQYDIQDYASEANKKILMILSSFHVYAKNLDSRIHAGKILFSRSRGYSKTSN